MELYSTLEMILTTVDVNEKLERFERLYEAYRSGDVTRNEITPIVLFSTPSYQGFCTVTSPQDVPRRTKLGTPKGQILLLHAIAHIEYSAIDLALDALYRFRDLPDPYYADWFKVAEDEVRHFRMIEALLQELGSYYGEIPVHNALFEASGRTLNLLERMAVVPRYLEANGLDATPLILKKLSPLKNDPMVKKIMDSLQIILDEEVDHVRYGDVWFEYACKRENVDPSIYFEIIERHYPSSFPRRVGINCDARLRAGFSAEELKKMSMVPC